MLICYECKKEIRIQNGEIVAHDQGHIYHVNCLDKIRDYNFYRKEGE